MSKVDFSYLISNVVGVVREAQIKLGPTSSPISLYYPLAALNRQLGTNASAEEMQTILEDFKKVAAKTLGQVSVSHEPERFCFTVSVDGCLKVLRETDDGGFLKEFTTLVQLGGNFDEVKALFCKFSEKAICKTIGNDEFDAVFYFADGKPDDFRYCVKFEEDHTHYHRFTPMDFAAFGYEI